jgi:pyruvate ferredoxin oxidoreductase gamma subunit
VLQLRIQGRGGQGAQMAGEVLARTYFEEGKFVQAYSTYGGARRGTPVSTFIRVDDTFIRERCDIESPDAIVCFDPSLLSPMLLAGAKPGTVVLINSSRPPDAFVDLGDFRFGTLDAIVVAQANGLGRYVNSAILGAFVRMIGSPSMDALTATLLEVSPAKPEQNAQCARDGYRMVSILGEAPPADADAATAASTTATSTGVTA